MRRRPAIDPFTVGPHETLGPNRPPSPSFEGDVITPFLVCGGITFFTVLDEPTPFDARPAGVQLVTSLYVPKGYVGFVKQLRVAPFMPPELADPWTTTGWNPVGPPASAQASWRFFPDAVDATNTRAAGTNGVWTTPFGWESYWDEDTLFVPHWEWMLRLLPGDPISKRPAFNFGDALTWMLQPNVAVPLTAYPNGIIPGAAPSAFWGPQRMQVLQDSQLNSHVLVPEDTTLCLFTRWQQSLYVPQAFGFDGEGSFQGDYGPEVYPLLPSFGQLHGYLQSMSAPPSHENARHGWGG